MNERLIAITLTSLTLASCTLHNDYAEHAMFHLPSKLKGKNDSWIYEPRTFPGSPAISPKAYWQTQMTKLPMAVAQLSDDTIIELTDELAEYYAGPHYKRQFGTRPYLVRAVFWNYTGDFRLYWHDSDLYVHHTSLGWLNGETKLPLVINLKQPPKAVYTHMNAAPL